ncbi:MAG TPA: MATE family efflux transporter [Dehalococcoidia bacterium]|nr:MATE family efflux transporter [Dehalococcoidia bacterium]
MNTASLGKGRGQHRDWTQGSIFSNLVSLYWPMLISSLLNMMGPTIDMIWIGRLGASSIAGVGVSAIVIMVVNSLAMGIFTGTGAMVARFVGARDEVKANLVAQQAIVIGLAYSIFFALVGVFLADRILLVLGVEADVVEQGTAYMRIQLVGMVTMTAVASGQSIINASGETRTSMKISLVYRLLHVALAPFLIFGWWFFPKLGVSGAALSNVICQAIGGTLVMWILFKGHTRLRITLKHFRFDRNIIWRTLKIGFPASITHIERSFSELILVRFIIPFGTYAVASHSVVQRIDQFPQMICGSLGSASGVLAGQNLGAGQANRASRTGWIAAGLATIIAVIISVVVWLWAEDLIRVFNSDEQLVNIASTFLRIQIVGYIFWGLVTSLSMCLNGVGDTVITMVTNLTTMWGFAITMAYVLSQHTNLGVYGIRWAIVGGIVIRAIIYSTYFKIGRWQKKQV